ncbi:MAG: sigma-70 family RNA polymerase sigma factor [Phycisphaerae bacterium]|nr:sigma-70 family RNA polymerase sigma factor [Phycisphaerae bacterium]
MPEPPDLTQLMRHAAAGDRVAADRLLPLVYAQLRAVARDRMRGERHGHTLQATALVHEAYVKLVNSGDVEWGGRAQFFLAASEAMRRILIDHARKKGAAKRGGRAAAVSLGGVADLARESSPEQIVSFDDAFVRLEREMPQAAAVVRLRFFAGLTAVDTARALGVSERTVMREWTYARAWLARELSREGPPRGHEGEGDRA